MNPAFFLAQKNQSNAEDGLLIIDKARADDDDAKLKYFEGGDSDFKDED